MPRPARLAGLAAALSLPLASGAAAAQAQAPSAVQAPPPAPSFRTPYALSPQDRGLAERAAAYLQGLATVSARFEQAAPDGQVTRGVLYLQRPGKARFEYDPPARMLIVSDGRTVALSDLRLKSFDRAPLSATPLNILLAKQVRLDRGVKIGRVDRNAEGFALTAVDIAHEADGRLVIYFADAAGRLALKGWNVVDAQGRTTKVRLGDLQPRSGLSPELFVVRDPRTIR